MLWKYFLEMHQLDLFNLWCNWVPQFENSENYVKSLKTYYVKNPDYQFWYNHVDGEFYEDGNEFIELVDNGTRILSFENFVCSAYENSIP